MILLRLLLILTALTLASAGGMYLLTNDRRYLRFCGQVVRFVVVALLVAGLLYLIERYVLVGWGILI